jgi:predicted dienelactone hydrolase
MTDERIRAVLPMAPEGTMLFGERGLSTVDRPTLILVGTADTGCDYKREATYIFEHIGTPDKFMISTIKVGGSPLYYLQGQEDYAKYFSEDFVSKRDGLAWGVYKGE